MFFNSSANLTCRTLKPAHYTPVLSSFTRSVYSSCGQVSSAASFLPARTSFNSTQFLRHFSDSANQAETREEDYAGATEIDFEEAEGSEELISSPAVLTRRVFREETRLLKALTKTNYLLGDTKLPKELQVEVNKFLIDSHYNPNKNNWTYHNDYPIWYLANRFPTEFAVSQAILFDAIKRLPYFNAHENQQFNVLDMNSQTNANFHVLQQLLGLDQVDNYVSIETNRNLSELGAELIGTVVSKEALKHCQIYYRSKLPEYKPKASKTEEISEEDRNRGIEIIDTVGDLNLNEELPEFIKNQLPLTLNDNKYKQIPLEYDVIFLTYSLNIVSEARRKTLLQEAWKYTKRGGIMIIVEDDTENGFQIVKQAREHILAQFGTKSRSNPAENRDSNADSTDFSYNSTHATVLAPCAHDYACPMHGNSVCKFRTRLQWSTIPKLSPLKLRKSENLQPIAGLVLEGYSYVVLHKGIIETDANTQFIAQNSSQNPASKAPHTEEHTTDEAEASPEATRSALYSGRFARVLTHPKKTIQGEVQATVCSPAGQLETWQFLQHRDGLQQGYEWAKACDWGDRLPFSRPISRRFARRMQRLAENPEREIKPQNNAREKPKAKNRPAQNSPKNHAKSAQKSAVSMHKGQRFSLVSDEEFQRAKERVEFHLLEQEEEKEAHKNSKKILAKYEKAQRRTRNPEMAAVEEAEEQQEKSKAQKYARKSNKTSR
jgi:ribosomal protein RSM22 (predicted rRNA methylase)